MNRSLRFGTALSALATAGLLSGCATGQPKSFAQGSATSPGKVGLAMKAQVALESGDFATGIDLAEQAVQHSPAEAAFRAVLGSAYFGAGRFASAEAAYRDSLSISPGQPAVVLKLALARIALGKNVQALADLEAARNYLEAADYGLAIALAGQPADAVAVLGQAARLPGADARLRQNLALAHALSGDWTMARTIAAQDVDPGELDSRLQQWMAMATPVAASDQIAALTGIRPVADPGQPVHLALNTAQPAERLAQAAPVPQPVAVVAPSAPAAVQYAAPEPVEYIVPRPRPQAEPVVAELPAPAPEMPTIAEAMYPAEPVPVPASEPASEPGQQVAQVLLHSAAQPAVAAAPLPTRFEAKPVSAEFVAPKVRQPVRASGSSSSVVQLGAYGSLRRVAAAWDQFANRFSSLNRYTPVSARFSSSKGTVYRLSVKGFASESEAQRLCSSLRSEGKNCFVRRVAGDSPVQFAAR